MTDQPGGEPIRMLGERYEIGELIGRGGMAEVHRGHDLRLGRRVAVKIMRPELARDPSFHQRFQREAHSAASLNHTNIVAVYDTGEDILGDGGQGTRVPYIVMEFVEGMTLRQVLNSGRRLLPERALEITAGVLAALDYSHRHGIVHRDIKPANVMVTGSGDVKVMDFGIARALSGQGQTMTATSAVMGTAQYLSPEQARGEVVDARSDIYSTGCLLYELLTNRPPFTGESPVSIAYQHVSEQPTPPSQIDPGVPERLDAIVMRALAKDPNDRYQTAADFKVDVERAAAGATVSVVPPAATATQILPTTQATAAVPAVDPDEKKNPWIWVGLIAAIALVAAGAIALGSSLFGNSATETVLVPNLRGLEEGDAEATLETYGLRLGTVKPEASDQPVDTIISQDPAAGEKLEKGQAVDVTISAGQEEGEVPSLIGLTSPEDARSALEEVGLALGTVEQRDSDQPENYVLDQDPPAGRSVELGTRVDIVVSNGTVAVPDVIGDSEAQARSDISNAGLTVEVSYQRTDSAAAGSVLAQTPSARTKVKRGTLVSITVAQAPLPSPSPSPSPGTEGTVPEGEGRTPTTGSTATTTPPPSE